MLASERIILKTAVDRLPQPLEAPMESELTTFAHANRWVRLLRTRLHAWHTVWLRCFSLQGMTMRLVAPCQAVRQTHTRVRPTAVFRIIIFRAIQSSQ